MPCAIRNLPSQIPAKHAAPSVAIEIDGEKDGQERTFSTLDLIEGNVVVRVTRETVLSHVDITFEGKCLPLRFKSARQVSIELSANCFKVSLQHLPVEQSHLYRAEGKLRTTSFV